MKIYQSVLLVFVTMWAIGDMSGASHFENASLSICMAIAMAINENAHKLIWSKIKSLVRS
jgi:hypothetical protein